MNSIERLKAFEEFIDACENEKEKQWIGCGNPLAPILIVGKEPACPKEDAKKEIEKNIRIVKDCFYNGDLVNLFLQEYNGVRGSTWSRYQTLMDFILYGSPIKRNEIQNFPFGVWSFITEINNTTSLKTKDAENNTEHRKALFENSAFIKDFPVVLLACGKDYINNDEGHWEINRIFGVEFDKNWKGRSGVHDEFGKGYEFYTHHSEDGKRLVIHMPQISHYLNDEPLEAIAKIVRSHLTKDKFPNHYIYNRLKHDE